MLGFFPDFPFQLFLLKILKYTFYISYVFTKNPTQ